ncbi:hypothetical protein A3Q56_05991 [Intoshia linei]|uniref:Uncharacterized protein n=1 Tax=Intoshia linei TaxID=1819745 RepID=A0A177AW84_9BILA|nr:hypothetical protein A3Q56_05991 [Intoshia linei]
MSVNYSNQLHLLNEKVKNENYLPEEEWFNSVNDILKTNENSNITCEILANLCRLDEGRKLCHEKLDYEIVLNLFKDNFNKQYFRLVANITYESGETRQKLLKCENISNLNHVVVLINKKESQDFIKAIVGMVLNLCIDSFNFCSMFIKAGVLNCVLNVLKDSENALYTDLSWQLLSVLSASGSSQILSDDFVDFLIINLNNKSTENSILEYVFEILTNIIVDNDKCMKLMIDKKCFETLLNQNDTYLEKSLKLVVFLSSYDNCIDEIDFDLVSKKLFHFLKYKDTIYEYVMLIFGNLCRNKNFNVKCIEMNLANEITVKINEKCSPDILYALCATLKNLLVIST